MADCLLVIDMQNDFCDPQLRPGALDGCGPVAERIDALAGAARAAGVPVVWVRTHHSEATDTPVWLSRHAGSEQICRPGTPGAEFYGVHPRDGEPVVTKHRYNAFLRTDLEERLRALGVDHVVCCGVLTNVCVESTAREAFQRDFDVTLVDDACQARSAEIHAATLANIARHFGRVATVADILARWARAA